MGNIFDNVARINENIVYPKKKNVDEDKGSYVVNLDILSHGIKSDLDIQKVGSDTRSYFEYHQDSESYVKKLKR